VHFQGVAWVGMKLLWDRVMPMLQCWKVLVPVKMVDDFDHAISSLENLAWRPERIKLPLAGRNVQGAPDGGGRQQPLTLHPYPDSVFGSVVSETDGDRTMILLVSNCNRLSLCFVWLLWVCFNVNLIHGLLLMRLGPGRCP
jgi:hypothetical protein